MPELLNLNTLNSIEHNDLAHRADDGEARAYHG